MDIDTILNWRRLLNKFITIDGRNIGKDFPPYLIAEMSANHNGDFENAKKIIQLAKNAGADAVKIQTYRADTITIDSDMPDFQISDGLWAGRSLYQLYDWAHTPWDWHKPLFEYAKEVGITIFSSPFDFTAIDLLEDLNAPAYKIASFEAIDLPLIKYAASTKKPLIISTGMADQNEIQEAIDAALSAGCQNLAILHCVSGYPAPVAEYNLQTISDMQSRYGLVTGLSDHTLTNITAITSVALGASIVEKHFTLDRNGGGPDDSFSLEPSDLKDLADGLKTAWIALGRVNYERKESEKGNLKFRRSLYFIEDGLSGQLVTPKMVRSIRPGFGMPPKMINQIIGKVLKCNVKRGMPVTADCFDN